MAKYFFTRSESLVDWRCSREMANKRLPASAIDFDCLHTARVCGIREYRTPHLQGDILFIHGEKDEITRLSDLLIWATPQKHLITVLPGANHFFTGYLKQLNLAISRFLNVE